MGVLQIFGDKEECAVLCLSANKERTVCLERSWKPVAILSQTLCCYIKSPWTQFNFCQDTTTTMDFFYTIASVSELLCTVGLHHTQPPHPLTNFLQLMLSPLSNHLQHQKQHVQNQPKTYKKNSKIFQKIEKQCCKLHVTLA